MTHMDMQPAQQESNRALDVTPFQFEGRNVRLVDMNGETWFVATDAAAELGYREAYDLTRSLDDDEKVPHTMRTPGGQQEVTLISEAGLYRAIVQRKTTKKMDDRLKARISRFQRWVFHDVLPSIRRTGSYSVQQPAPQFQLPQTFAEALMLAAKQAEKIEKQAVAIADMTPKAEFHDAVTEAINSQPIRDIAKVLGTGQNRMFKWLRDTGILMSNNTPYQRFVDEGYFRVVEKSYKDQVGEAHTYTRTLVTGKGLTYLQKKWAQAHNQSKAA